MAMGGVGEAVLIIGLVAGLAAGAISYAEARRANKPPKLQQMSETRCSRSGTQLNLLASQRKKRQSSEGLHARNI